MVAIGVMLRCYTPSPLWLDESITVSIARLPLSHLQDALKVDGAPPLYYVLLHGWLRLFGASAIGARSLSGLLGIATLPLVWLAGRREAGPSGGRTALLLLASSPFAVYYSTEARMYSLVLFLVTVGYLLLRRALEEPTVGRLLALPFVAAALALTHYWSLFLLVVIVTMLSFRAWRGPDRRAALRCAGAVAAGALLFLPWLPTFLFQAAHTGTPWAQPAQYSAIAAAVSEWAGGGSNQGRVLGLIFIALAGAGLLGRRLDARRMIIDLSPPPVTAALATVFVGTLALALSAGLVSGSGFAARYTIVAFLPFLLLLVHGLEALPTAATRPVLTLAVIAGLSTALVNPTNTHKTDANLVAAAIRAGFHSGDVVAYCPDQLGPAVSRLLDSSLPQLVYPTGGPPQRVDWVDYERRNVASRPSEFAALLAAHHPRTIWYVEATDYRTFEGKCEQVDALLTTGHRRRVLVSTNRSYFEHPALIRYDGGPR